MCVLGKKSIMTESFSPHWAQGTKMKELAVLLNTNLKTDECGDQIIIGTNGNIHADGNGYSLYLSFKSSRKQNRALIALKSIGMLKQCGDREFVIQIKNRPEKGHITLLREHLKPRQKPQFSAEYITTLKERGKALASQRKIVA